MGKSKVGSHIVAPIVSIAAVSLHDVNKKVLARRQKVGIFLASTDTKFSGSSLKRFALLKRMSLSKNQASLLEKRFEFYLVV